MIGFNPMASTPLAALSSSISAGFVYNPHLPGGTSRIYGPQPFAGYQIPDPAEPRRKPFRPVWDRGGEVEQLKPPPAPPPAPTPLPPASLFGQPRLGGPVQVPHFAHLAPPNPVEIGRQLVQARDQTDMNDIMQLLTALMAQKPTIH